MIDNDGQYQNEYDENEEYMEQNEEEINQTDLNENQNNLEQIIEPPIDSKKAIEDYKKICAKTYASPSTQIISQLRSDTLNLFLENFELKGINAIVKILNKYTYFLHIKLGPYDPRRGESMKQKKAEQNKNLTQGEQDKEKREKRDQEIQRNLMIKNIVLGISKNLKISLNLITFNLTNLKITKEMSEVLSPGLINNKSLQALSINNCTISIESYDISTEQTPLSCFASIINSSKPAGQTLQ